MSCCCCGPPSSGGGEGSGSSIPLGWLAVIGAIGTVVYMVGKMIVGAARGVASFVDTAITVIEVAAGSVVGVGLLVLAWMGAAFLWRRHRTGVVRRTRKLEAHAQRVASQPVQAAIVGSTQKALPPGRPVETVSAESVEILRGELWTPNDVDELLLHARLVQPVEGRRRLRR